MWNDPCRWTRTRLPLMAGDDLLGADRRRARRHLIGCPACRGRLEELHASLGVLHAAAALAPARAGAPPLWPELARQIREARHPAPSSWGIPWSNLGLWSGVALASGLLVSAGLLLRPDPGPASVARQDSAVAKPTAPAPRVALAPALAATRPKVAIVARLRPKPAEPKPEPQVAQASSKAPAPAEPAPAPAPALARHDDAADRVQAPQPEPTR